MSPVNTTETFDSLIPMVSLLSGVGIILSVIISIITLILVIKIYRRK